jgi:hypothetical protein
MSATPTSGSLTLSRAELVELTEKRQGGAQARVLRALGIDHKRRPDGSIVVLRNSLQAGLASAKVRGREFRIAWEGEK